MPYCGDPGCPARDMPVGARTGICQASLAAYCGRISGEVLRRWKKADQEAP
jgi:hypothetical protein